ncbi:hypothetical protein [Alkalitalea saponilacus]|uniref:Uncharacterized protein n=1 Tax=Alkalitalea saponilacus TaxID=889453 RepID=A0A1T5ANQ9_9BACT|nr:hypothetical protein [Alkalitalea saponilacus]ASB48643.1 hypothetical protein CDL62_05550 [Alkalitalea saponilacus]SKB36622.1 hypothetical protein SAMN03080601_00330 [Alkalitalea saponilacus]
MKKIITLISISFVILFAKGQAFSDSLYFHLYNYQIIKGELKADLELDKLCTRFNIEELIDSTNVETFSLYKFYHLEYEDPLTSFLIIKPNKIEIYDLLSFDALIETILDTSIDEKVKALWIKEVLRMLRGFYEVVDMERLVIQKDFGKYQYFIPLSNLKNKEGIIR